MLNWCASVKQSAPVVRYLSSNITRSVKKCQEVSAAASAITGKRLATVEAFYSFSLIPEPKDLDAHRNDCITVN